MSMTEFLNWLAWAGGASIAVAFIFERIKEFQELDSAKKSMISLLASILVSLAAFAILRYTPADLLKELAVWFQIVYGVCATWILGQVAHGADPAKLKGSKELPFG